MDARLLPPQRRPTADSTLHPNVQKLLDLQKVDLEIVSLRRDTSSLPAEEQKRRRKLDDLERIAAEKRDRATKSELDARALDKSVKGADDEIKKLNERLATVKNNAEYQATLFQIESVVRERDKTQDECLKLLEGQDAQKAEADAAEAVAAEERKVFEGFLAEAERLRKQCEEQVKGVVEKRKFVAEGIPVDLLDTYDRLFATRDNLAVCACERGFCQGCYNKVTTNDTARLMGGASIVHCDSCQRILYLQR